MRILHITTPAGFGGLERVVEMLARGTLDRGHEVSVLAVVSRASQSHPFVERMRRVGVAIEQVKLAERDYVGERRSVRATLARSKPHVMHCHGYRADVLDAGLAHSQGIAVVSTVHGFTGGGVKNRVYEWLQVRSFRRFDCVVAVSQPIVDRLVAAGVPQAVVRLVRNSFRPESVQFSRVEARLALGLEETGFHVGWIGRLSEEKGPDVMLRAALSLAKEGVHVSFIGDGPMQDGLRLESVRSGESSMVRFHGVVPEAGRLLSAFDVVAISSRTEGTPIVLLEAIAAGVPVVAARVGGIPYVVSNDEALLFDIGNSRQLVDSILRLKGDDQLAKRLATSASSRVERELNYGGWLDAYEDLYDSAMQAVAGRL